MNTRRMKISDLVEAPYNPRVISDRAMVGLKASVDRFGYVVPLVWNERSGFLVSGHQRLKVLKAKKVEEVDVVVVDLDEVEEKALNLTMNNPSVRGEFTNQAVDILSGMEGEVGALFEELRLDDLKYLLERIDLPGGEDDPDDDSGGGTPPSKRPKGDGMICPRCCSTWNSKTGEVLEGRNDG